MSDLTANQRDVLNAISTTPWRTGPELLSQLAPLGYTSVQGIHQTAASLVRHGLVQKQKVSIGIGPKVIGYKITGTGEVALKRAVEKSRELPTLSKILGRVFS